MDFLRYIQTIWTMALSVLARQSHQLGDLYTRPHDSRFRGHRQKTIDRSPVRSYIRATQVRIRGHSFPRVFCHSLMRFVIPTLGGISRLTIKNLEIPPNVGPGGRSHDKIGSVFD